MAIKTKNPLWFLLIGFLLLLFTLNLGSCDPSSERTPFEYYEMSGSILVAAPLENANISDSNVVLNLTLRVDGYEFGANTNYFPYQNISCVYSLDGSEWQNMTFVSAVEGEQWQSRLFWYSKTWMNYTATLQDVPDGSHYLKFDVQPGSLRTNETLIHFNVVGQPSTLTDNTPMVAAIGVIIVVAVAVIAIMYVKKVKKINQKTGS
jgi:hypothetical protein